MGFIEGLLHFIQVCSRYYYAGLIVTAVYLVTPPEAFEILRAREIAEHYRPHVFLGFIICLIPAAHYLTVWIYRRYEISRLEGERKSQIAEWMGTLAEQEKQILRFYIRNHTRTNVLCCEYPFAQSLIGRSILQANDRVITDQNFPKAAYIIDEGVWDYLNSHADCLLGSTNSTWTDHGKSLVEYLEQANTKLPE